MPQFNQRFWKILGITLIKGLLFLFVALILVYLVWGHTEIGEILFQAAPIIATGWGIKNVFAELRTPPPLKR